MSIAVMGMHAGFEIIDSAFLVELRSVGGETGGVSNMN
jgi:hypothetical protein